MTEDKPRVLLLSQRELRARVSRCVGFELESIIASVSDAEWALPRPSPAGFLPEVAVNRLNKRFRSASQLRAPFSKIDTGNDFDVLVVVAQIPADLITLSAIPGWRSRAKHTVCFVEEMWSVELDRWKGHIKTLDQFDHVFLGSLGTVEPLADRLSTPVSYLPFAVDTELFSSPPETQRWIDVFNIGRRSPITHRALLDWAATNNRMYYHDTFTPGDFYNIEQHRRLLADLMRRTSIAITNRGIGSRPYETGGQEELAFRYFEAAAAGAVLVGKPPNTGVGSAVFGWEDAIIPADFDVPDMGAFIDDILGQTERIAAIRDRNRRESLLQHDHVYRWETMLAAVEVKPGPAVVDRKARLAELADGYAPTP